MEWTLGPGVGNGVEGWQDAVAAADLPAIRWFDVPNEVAAAPADDSQGSWSVCSPKTAGTMSAIGFFYGRALHRELGVPIGLIGCNWGGTPAEAWTSEEFLARRDDFGDALARLREARAGDERPTLDELQRAWWERLEATDAGSREKWNRADLDDSGWTTTQEPGGWNARMSDFDGVVWYRRTVEIPQEWVGRDLVVELGPIDDFDDFWADGQHWGKTHEDGRWSTPRLYRIAAKLVADARLVLAVRALDTGGGGGFHGAPETMKLYRQNFPDKTVPLAGEWKTVRGASLADLGGFPRQNWLNAEHPAALFNGMLASLTRTPVRGAIFYQGESNVGNPEQYATLFPDMVASWRAAWGRAEFPFYWVQIAPFRYGAGEQAARLREAQLQALELIPHGGMAVTMDVGHPTDIHPLKKIEVGERLALWALAGPYGRDGVEAHGPEYANQRADGAALILTLRHAAGLRTRDGKTPSHFQIAGADRQFHPAEAKVVGETVVLTSAAVPHPVAARYGWGEADMPNLVNGAGLPASSFRTDDWPRP
jgi:sialate O-acetylesterase